MHHGGLVYAAMLIQTTSPGLRQDGTKDLETVGGRTNSKAMAPETKRDSGSTDLWSITSVAPASEAGC